MRLQRGANDLNWTQTGFLWPISRCGPYDVVVYIKHIYSVALRRTVIETSRFEMDARCISLVFLVLACYYPGSYSITPAEYADAVDQTLQQVCSFCVFSFLNFYFNIFLNVRRIWVQFQINSNVFKFHPFLQWVWKKQQAKLLGIQYFN